MALVYSSFIARVSQAPSLKSSRNHARLSSSILPGKQEEENVQHRTAPAPRRPIQSTKTTALRGFPPLPYYVHRTPSHELPVYHLAKRGGNLHQTRIRKIDGDVKALRDELQSVLKLKKEDAIIHQLTGHIILKGWHKCVVKRYLEAQQF